MVGSPDHRLAAVLGEVEPTVISQIQDEMPDFIEIRPL